MEWGLWLFGPEDEVKVKELQEIFNIKDYETAKELYIQIKNKVN